MYSRAAVAFAFLSLIVTEAQAGAGCPPPHVVTSPANNESSAPDFDPELLSFESTSFRGLNLGLSRSAALNTVSRLGFAIASTASDSQMDFCMGADVVGSLRFNENNQLIKLELRPAYFGVSKVVLREFADAVFEHYKVRLTKVDDDACFADVICFRGTTLKDEKFLILRIGADVMLHVSR